MQIASCTNAKFDSNKRAELDAQGGKFRRTNRYLNGNAPRNRYNGKVDAVRSTAYARSRRLFGEIQSCASVIDMLQRQFEAAGTPAVLLSVKIQICISDIKRIAISNQAAAMFLYADSFAYYQNSRAIGYRGTGRNQEQVQPRLHQPLIWQTCIFDNHRRCPRR